MARIWLVALVLALWGPLTTPAFGYTMADDTNYHPCVRAPLGTDRSKYSYYWSYDNMVMGRTLGSQYLAPTFELITRTPRQILDFTVLNDDIYLLEEPVDVVFEIPAYRLREVSREEAFYRILKYSNGRFVRTIAPPTDPNRPLHLPLSLAVDPGLKRLYVANSGMNTVDYFSLEGEYLGSWGGGSKSLAFAVPESVAVGADGSVFVVDEAQDLTTKVRYDSFRLSKLSSAGELLGRWNVDSRNNLTSSPAHQPYQEAPPPYQDHRPPQNYKSWDVEVSPDGVPLVVAINRSYRDPESSDALLRKWGVDPSKLKRASPGDVTTTGNLLAVVFDLPQVPMRVIRNAGTVRLGCALPETWHWGGYTGDMIIMPAMSWWTVRVVDVLYIPISPMGHEQGYNVLDVLSKVGMGADIEIMQFLEQQPDQK